MTTTQFENKLLKRCSKKHFKVSNSYGNKQAWRWIKKNKWLNIGQPITEKQFGYIIKKINEYLVSKLLRGSSVVFPYRMGKLELVKRRARINFNNGKLDTNLPIDWKRTLNWWKEDNKAFKNRYLLRHETDMLFRIRYNKKNALYKNKKYYQFTISRRVKKLLSDKINNNEIDAFLIDYGRLH